MPIHLEFRAILWKKTALRAAGKRGMIYFPSGDEAFAFPKRRAIHAINVSSFVNNAISQQIHSNRMGPAKLSVIQLNKNNYMDPYYYLIPVWLSSFMLPAKQPELPEAMFKSFELSNLWSVS